MIKPVQIVASATLFLVGQTASAAPAATCTAKQTPEGVWRTQLHSPGWDPIEITINRTSIRALMVCVSTSLPVAPDLDRPAQAGAGLVMEGPCRRGASDLRPDDLGTVRKLEALLNADFRMSACGDLLTLSASGTTFTLTRAWEAEAPPY